MCNINIKILFPSSMPHKDYFTCTDIYEKLIIQRSYRVHGLIFFQGSAAINKILKDSLIFQDNSKGKNIKLVLLKLNI